MIRPTARYLNFQQEMLRHLVVTLVDKAITQDSREKRWGDLAIWKENARAIAFLSEYLCIEMRVAHTNCGEAETLGK